ncbi:unnamed protein product, partial [marine sediment metagenome]
GRRKGIILKIRKKEAGLNELNLYNLREIP